MEARRQYVLCPTLELRLHDTQAEPERLEMLIIGAS